MSELIAAALAELGVRRMLLAIHDVSFPADPDEDIGRGSPSTRAAQRFLEFAKDLGFTGIQLGPQGQTSRDNPSPYDGTIFSRHVATIALGSFAPGGPYEGLVDGRTVEAARLREPAATAQHRHAYDAIHALIEAADRALAAGRRPDITERLAAFRAEHRSWLEPDALFAAICAEQRGRSFRDWPDELGHLWDDAAHASQVGELLATHAPSIRRYALGQLFAHEEHARVRATTERLGLALYGDFQVGYSEADKWVHARAFLRNYAMGAPPSRTNPDGQPWNYPVLDPDQLTGAARALVVARVDKALAEYDSLRIDHPHGLVCPWVYRADTDDAARAVREGARLFESPDLPDHPALARFAIARADQIDRGAARHADRWVRALDDAQVTRYAVLFEALAEAAARHGRARADLSCEVLSTLPLPLQRVIERYGLGRWRVTQKANLADPTDVYRSENARREDWVMLGNHDTSPVFALIRGWTDERRRAWVAHLAHRLRLSRDAAAALATSPGRLASAMLAELFVCDAENVSIFFADLFGLEDRFNAPGTVSEDNWSLRLPPDFDARYAQGRARGDVLDLRLALALALEARGSTSGLAAALRA